MDTTLCILACVTTLNIINAQLAIERHQNPDINFYTSFLFDDVRDQLIIGARDNLLVFNVNNIVSPKNVYRSPPTDSAVANCIRKGQSADQCRNFIKVLLRGPSERDSTNDANDEVYVCGTNAFAPKCAWRKLSDVGLIVEDHLDGKAKSPSSLTWNTTTIITKDGDTLYAGPLEFQGRDPEIFRNSPEKSVLRSVRYDYKWLNSDANFLLSFEYEAFVYFIFRESAVEFMNCGRTVYSRIARVCKNDTGGFREGIWTTYLKARLNCSMPGQPGQFPFYFDEIQDVTFTEGDDIIYGIFATAENSIHGSAICAFQMNEVNHSFKGPFKYQRSTYNSWEQVHHTDVLKEQFECKSTGGSYDEQLERSNRQQNYQLMHESVTSMHGTPFVVETSEKFKKIAVDKVETRYRGDVRVFFVLTESNMLRRYAVWPYSVQACFIDETQISELNDTIYSFKLLKETHSLYIGSKKSFVRVTLSACDKHLDKEVCLKSGDPYCGWNSKLKRCTSASYNTVDDFWTQARESNCKNSQESNWLSWSHWEKCKQINKSDDESCLCRNRKCSGTSCIKKLETEVVNCTAHGGWSDWTPWSSCSVTCGKGIKTRSRSCTNPQPSYGGRQCSGSRRETIECPFVPCPTTTTTTESPRNFITRHFLWSDWSEWSECTQPCGGGHQLRNRQCLTPGQCVGCDAVWQECNIEPCEEVVLKTDWTNWYRKNDTVAVEGYYEERQKFVCRAINMRGSNDLQISTRKENRQIDLSSNWSECSSSCDGFQFRWIGPDYVKRPCSDPCAKNLVKVMHKSNDKYNKSQNEIDNSIRTSAWSEKVGVSNTTLTICYCIASAAVGIVVGYLVRMTCERRKSILPEKKHVELNSMFSSNKKSNTYVTRDDFKMNNFNSVTTNLLQPTHYNTLPSTSKVTKVSMSMPREATIKRTSTIRAKLTSDQNF